MRKIVTGPKPPKPQPTKVKPGPFPYSPPDSAGKPVVPPRHFDCVSYVQCLNKAIVAGWASWACDGCSYAPDDLEAEELSWDDVEAALPPGAVRRGRGQVR